MKEVNEMATHFPNRTGVGSTNAGDNKHAAYQPPMTKRTGVETEGGLCAASIVPDEPDTSQQNITIEEQKIGNIGFYDGTDGNDGGWDY